MCSSSACDVAGVKSLWRMGRREGLGKKGREGREGEGVEGRREGLRGEGEEMEGRFGLREEVVVEGMKESVNTNPEAVNTTL